MWGFDVIIIILTILLLVIWYYGTKKNIVLTSLKSHILTRQDLPSIFHTLKGILFGIKRKPFTSIQRTSDKPNDLDNPTPTSPPSLTPSAPLDPLQLTIERFSFTPEELQQFQAMSSQHTSKASLYYVFPHFIALQAMISLVINPWFPIHLVGAVHLRSYYLLPNITLLEDWLQQSQGNEYSLVVRYVGLVPIPKKGTEIFLTMSIIHTHTETLIWKETVVLYSTKRILRTSEQIYEQQQDREAKELSQQLTQQFDFTNIVDTVEQTPSLMLLPSDTWNYAMLSGDINPIHLHPLFGKLLGQSGMIAHGALVVAKALECLTKEESVSSYPKQLGVSFKGPTPSDAKISLKTESQTNNKKIDNLYNVDIYCENNKRPSICLRTSK